MSTEEQKQARLLINQALQALKAGNPAQARILAEEAAVLAPDLEEPWLVLAAAVNPAESLKYLQRALKVNPASQRARQGMHWAVKRQREDAAKAAAAVEPFSPVSAPAVVEENAPVAAPIIAAPIPQVTTPVSLAAAALPTLKDISPASAPVIHDRKKPVKSSRAVSFWVPALMVTAALCLVALIWFGLPIVQEAFANAAAPRPIGVIFKPSLTSTNTPTSTPTATPTPTPTSTPTPTPTDTPTPTPTDTPTPLPTNTPLPPTEAPETVGIPSEVESDTHWIDVDLSAQRAYAYEGTTLMNTFIVSTGTWQYPTVTGEFHVYVKYRYADMSGPGYYLPDVPYVQYFYQGYGLHGTYWHNNFGTPMSHGCVNFRIEDAGWVYDFLPLGGLVNVHD